jgi:hypothetical protein
MVYKPIKQFFRKLKKKIDIFKNLTIIKYFMTYEFKSLFISIVGFIFYIFCLYLSFKYDFLILKKIVNLEKVNVILELKQNMIAVKYYTIIKTEILPKINGLRTFTVYGDFDLIDHCFYFIYVTIPLTLFGFPGIKDWFYWKIDRINKALNLFPNIVCLQKRLAVIECLGQLKTLWYIVLKYKHIVTMKELVYLTETYDKLKFLLELLLTLNTEYNSNLDLITANKIELNELMELTQVTSYVFLSYSF